METAFSPFIKKLNKIDLERIGVRIVAENSDVIIELVKNTQLGQGLDSKGELLIHPTKRGKTSPSKAIGYYNNSTEKKYREVGASKPKIYGERYNFEWTSSTFATMYIESSKDNKFSIFSKEGKKKDLEKKYQTKLFDLTEKNNKEVNEKILLPKIQEYILNNFFYKL